VSRFSPEDPKCYVLNKKHENGYCPKTQLLYTVYSFSIDEQTASSHCATLPKYNNILSTNIEVRITGRITNEVKPSMKII
jgi:hypothetical protein